jgi:hypothetical protein
VACAAAGLADGLHERDTTTTVTMLTTTDVTTETPTDLATGRSPIEDVGSLPSTLFDARRRFGSPGTSKSSSSSLMIVAP